MEGRILPARRRRLTGLKTKTDRSEAKANSGAGHLAVQQRLPAVKKLPRWGGQLQKHVSRSHESGGGPGLRCHRATDLCAHVAGGTRDGAPKHARTVAV